MAKTERAFAWLGGVLAVLRIKAFTLLWLGQIVSMFGDYSQSIGLSVFIFKETGSNLALGTAVALQALPVMLFGPIGGVYVDRLNKRRLMIACDLFRCALVDSLVFIHSLPYLYCVSFLVASAGVFFNIAKNASIPHLVEEDRLTSANSLTGLASSLIQVIGPAAGGIVVAIKGPVYAFGINALSFLASAAFLLPVRIPDSRDQGADERSFRASFAQGLRELWRNRRLARFTALMMLSFFALGGVQVLFPGFILGSLKLGSKQLGSIISTQGMGALAGALFLSLLARKLNYTTILSAGMIGLAAGLCILGFSRLMAPACIGMFIAGLSLAAINVGANTTIMRLVPRDRLGRVGGAIESLSTGLSLLAMVAAAFLADRVGIPVIFEVTALVLGGAGLYGFLALYEKSSSGVERQMPMQE